MKYSQEDKVSIQLLHLITGKSYKDCKDFFEGFASMISLAFLKKTPLHVPLFGDIRIKHIGDEVKKEGKKIKVQIDFDLDPFMSRNLGQLVDGTESEVQKIFVEKIKDTLERFVS